MAPARQEVKKKSGRTTPVLGVTSVFFTHGLLFASWVAHIPRVEAHLRIDLGQLGIALLGAPVGSILAMAGAGWLVPRLGSRRVLRVGMVGYCLAGALLGLAESFLAFFLLYMVWGLFQGTLEVAMNTQGVAVESRQGRPVMASFHGSWSLGALAGAGIGTAAVALDVSLTSQLLVLGSVTLAVLTVLTRRLLPSDRNDPGHGLGLAPSLAKRHRPGRWLTAALVALCVVALADMLCEGAAADWSAVYLRSSLHASGAIPGLGYTLYSLAMVATRFAGGRLLAKWETHRVLPVLTALATVGFAAGLAARDTSLMLVAFCGLGVGCALVIPTTYSRVGEIASANPGRGVALVSGIGWIGFVAGPPLIGQVAAATSLRFASSSSLCSPLSSPRCWRRAPPLGHGEENRSRLVKPLSAWEPRQELHLGQTEPDIDGPRGPMARRVPAARRRNIVIRAESPYVKEREGSVTIGRTWACRWVPSRTVCDVAFADERLSSCKWASSERCNYWTGRR